MPATSFDYSRHTYRIRCLGCGVEVHTDTPYNRDATTTEGEPVLSVFPWYSRGSFSTRCRECSRARNRARSTRRSTPVAGSALGTGRRFGVEMELIFPRGTSASTVSAALRNAGLTGWNVVSDCSLHATDGSGGIGWEVVSPILAGEDGYEAIRTATRALRAIGAKPNRTCGLHVHHEVRDLDLDGFKRLYRSFGENASLIAGLVAPSRRPGSREARFCGMPTDAEMRTIAAARDLSSVAHRAGGKFKALNTSYITSRGTVEIRLHQGTADAEKIVSWVRFGQGLIDAAATATPVAPASRMRDFLGSLGEHLNETARTFLLGRTVEFGAVAA